MAYTTGNSSGHKDLLGKLKTFLDAQSFTSDRYAANDEYLFSKVFSGSDKWYGGIKIYDNGVTNSRSWKLRVNTGFNNAADFDSQVGSISGTRIPALSLDENTGNPNLMTYWIVANTRRVAGVIKIGTSYQHFYLGLTIPYGLPSQIPYPAIVGGNTYVKSDSTIERYNSSSIIFNYWKLQNNSDTTDSSLALRGTDGMWYKINNYTTGNGKSEGRGVYPYCNFYGQDELYTGGGSVENFTGNLLYMKTAPDGCYNLLPVITYTNTPKAIWGELDGFKYLTGFNITAESTITEGADTYIVFPDKGLSGEGNFIAMKTA